ncbi:ski-like protein isoform X1 [Canis lupus baileyi]|uniref:SKI like proto-onco n=4 Tax=Canis lupus TaxID=9612 RepID=A0A8C0SDH7_CANLF|nr:ski-like protein isoform X1 [Canis lupus familiaris]XP_038301982.1 ski-like protein isoform X1 [Canis lupus familiaris]XP_038301983.1 ski-like protein isoform X1 [Canis lupus familiaris]XP_038301984.1 ski-like protein isoform X1 [Canis lupus familiaris]XP_038318709.1 ski-like protein isoform X1 [Canis lupus familiaris]XP_038318711.1 ski-like protein isoform X1 [Canis lupus familiaris]XP_038318712.1 ski-like protein isoform X1 [Canis lupus familiaris]XP_038318713.1 ski-like protein isoform|eukprot:XP_005639967.1 ski-like protein isoform X1 [Canis lupus familiaris]
MANLQTSFSLLQGSSKKLNGMGDDGGPPVKKMMTDIHANGKMMINSKMPTVKKEHLDDYEVPMETDGEHVKRTCASVPEPLHLNPSLKHTLAQFHLSSQSSLGGPAAFSARYSQESMSPTVFLPLPSPQVLPGPLLIPSDSSTELTQTVLEGESISCFQVGGEKRLCLPQVLNSVLREFSLQQINTVCDELYIYCSRCTSDQLHILKVLGILPFNAPSCGLITLTDAQRLCNALLRPRTFPQNGSVLPAKNSLAQLKETGSAFEVEHECLGKCQGLFAPQFYVQPDAPCIQCLECCGMFAPQTFVMHSHRSPDKRTCHWGFESAKWHCYLHVNQKYLGTPEEKKLKIILEEMKEKFSLRNGKRTQSKIDTPSGMELQSWYPVIKQEGDHVSQTHSFLHPSYYLYMCDKVVAPNVSLTSTVSQTKEVTKTETSRSIPRQSEKPHSSGKHQKMVSYPDVSLEEQEKMDLKTSRELCSRLDPSISSNSTSKKKPESTTCNFTRDTSKAGIDHDTAASSPLLVKDIICEDDKGKIMEEVMRTYVKQQEKLNSILQKKQQLQMEVEMLSSSKAMKELTDEQQNLQKELESLQNEHAHRMEEFYIEQKDLEKKLEQVMKQKCTCDSNLEKDKEAEYAAQLAELRQRLDHAEADRQELQDELRQEREARQKLEMMIKELKLQILKSSKTAKE